MTNKCLVIFILFSINLFSQGQSNSKTLLFIGTYTEGKPDSGIYIYELNSNTGELKRMSTGENIVNPSFLTISPNGKYMYACTETKLPKHGSVSSFKIDSVNGKISFINKQPSMGENPVYLTVNKSNKFVVNGNYTEGNVAVFKINADGSLNPSSQIIQFKDSSVNKSRQEKAHIHSTIFSPNEDFIFFPDLGADKIRVFKFDADHSNPLSSKDNLTIKSSQGSGPRHFTFHPNNKFAYCVEELSGMISAYTYKDGKLDSVQKVFSYSKKQDSYACADIHISPDGLFLYASNRLKTENTISIFSISQSSGKLKLIGHQSTFGDHPRNFVIDQTGNFLIVANLTSNNIVVFKRDLKTGLLEKTKYEINVLRPACLKLKKYGN